MPIHLDWYPPPSATNNVPKSSQIILQQPRKNSQIELIKQIDVIHIFAVMRTKFLHLLNVVFI